MFHFISKLVYLFIAPENWIIVLLICRFASKSAVIRKRLTIAIIAIALIFGNEAIYNKLVNAWQPKPVVFASGVSYEAGIVLGGLSSFDKYGNGFFNGTADRFIQTCLLYKTGKIKKIIISGGSNAPNEPKDAHFQFAKMVELGIPASDIIVEDSSMSTFENAQFTKKKIDSLRLKPPFVLVTSAMHIPRAKMVFASAGVQVIPYPSNYQVLENKFTFSNYVLPDIGTLLSWSTFLKEIVGIAGYKLMGKA